MPELAPVTTAVGIIKNAYSTSAIALMFVLKLRLKIQVVVSTCGNVKLFGVSEKHANDITRSLRIVMSRRSLVTSTLGDASISSYYTEGFEKR